MMKVWLSLAGSIPLLVACPNSPPGDGGEGETVGEGEGDVGEGEGDVGEGEGDVGEGEGDAGEGEGDAGEGEGEGDAGEGEGEGEGCVAGEHDGGAGACVAEDVCSPGFHLSANGRCSRWIQLPGPPTRSITALVGPTVIQETIHVVLALANPNYVIGERSATGDVVWTAINNIGSIFDISSDAGFAYLVGGRDADGVETTDVRRAQVESGGRLADQIEVESQLVLQRSFAGSAVIEHELVVFGGFDGEQFLSSIETALIDEEGHVGSFALVGATPEALASPKIKIIENQVWIAANSSLFYHEIGDGYDVWSQAELPELMRSCSARQLGFICVGFEHDHVYIITIVDRQPLVVDLGLTPAPDEELVPASLGDQLYLMGGPLETGRVDFQDSLWAAELSDLQ